MARTSVNIQGGHLNWYEDSGIVKCVTHSSCQCCQGVNGSAVEHEFEKCLPDGYTRKRQHLTTEQ